MKKNYIFCIFSLIILILGFLGILVNLLFPVISPDIKSVILLYAICFIFIGLSAFAVHYKRYDAIKALENHDLPILTQWHFKTAHSPLLTTLLKDYKRDALSTLFFSFILILIFSYTFTTTYMPKFYYVGPLLSLIFLFVGILIVNIYFHKLTTGPITAVFGEETIYFIDDIYTLQKSIYFLDNVVIDTENEPKLQFLYGQIEAEDTPYFILEIPIPENQLAMAQLLRTHYLNEIKNISY